MYGSRMHVAWTDVLMAARSSALCGCGGINGAYIYIWDSWASIAQSFRCGWCWTVIGKKSIDVWLSHRRKVKYRLIIYFKKNRTLLCNLFWYIVLSRWLRNREALWCNEAWQLKEMYSSSTAWARYASIYSMTTCAFLSSVLCNLWLIYSTKVVY
jgi:hypothetical protein